MKAIFVHSEFWIKLWDNMSAILWFHFISGKLQHQLLLSFWLNSVPGIALLLSCSHIVLAEPRSGKDKRSALINKIKLRFGTQGSPRRNKVRCTDNVLSSFTHSLIHSQDLEDYYKEIEDLVEVPPEVNVDKVEEKLGRKPSNNGNSIDYLKHPYQVTPTRTDSPIRFVRLSR